MDRPLTHSVATLLDAMADPQPNVLKHESTMLPSPSTCAPRALAHAAAPSLRPSARHARCRRALICSFITSPHAGAPKAGANRDVGLVEGAYVARVVVVVHHLHAEAADASQRRKKAPAGHVRPRRAA